MRFIWQRLFPKGSEEVSPWVGLSIGALFLVAVAGVGTAALHCQYKSLTRQSTEHAKTLTRWLARDLTHIQAAGQTNLEYELRQAAREPGVSFLAIIGPDNLITAHSHSTQIGQQAPEIVVAEADNAPIQLGKLADDPSQCVLIASIASSSGTATRSRLIVGLSPTEYAWSQSDILLWSGYVLLAVMGLFLIAYRLLRRSFQPLVVIRNRLLTYNEPVEKSLAALRLNDSFDQLSEAWNHLIEFVDELQEELRQARLTSDVTPALDGYRAERLTELLMQIPFGVVVADEHHKISFANRAACGLLQAPEDGLEEQSISEILGEDLQKTLLSASASSRSGAPSASRWTDHVFEWGHTTTTLRFWSTLCASGSGDYVIFIQDVTQAKEAERARDDFLNHITHELRTPLTNIRAYAETLSQGVIDDERTVRECYNVIMGETSRLSQLVEDMLNISQLEVGTAALKTNEIMVADILRKVVQDNQGAADGKNIDLTLQLPAKLPRIRGDRGRLTEVFNNLIGNAVKYTPNDGRVEIRCAQVQQQVEVAVSDTGIGIDPKDHSKIFDKFYRVNDENVTSIPGTGLGLAIANETVRVHGGTLAVSSAAGEGSTFTVVLPALALDESENSSGTSAHATKEHT